MLTITDLLSTWTVWQLWSYAVLSVLGGHLRSFWRFLCGPVRCLVVPPSDWLSLTVVDGWIGSTARLYERISCR